MRFWCAARLPVIALSRFLLPAADLAALSQPGPAALLRPDRQVVAFIDRPELAGLRGLVRCGRPAARAVADRCGRRR